MLRKRKRMLFRHTIFNTGKLSRKLSSNVMKVIVENESVKLWLDAHAPIVFCKLFTAPEDRNNFIQLCKSKVKAIEQIIARRQHDVYSICDSTEMDPSQFELFMGHYMHHLPSLFKAGLRFQAIIIPRECSSGTWVHSFNKDMDNASIDIFNCFEKALDNINKRWAALSL